MTGAFPMVRSAIGGPDGRGDCRVVGEGAFTGRPRLWCAGFGQALLQAALGARGHLSWPNSRPSPDGHLTLRS